MWIFLSGCSVGSYVHKDVNYQTMGEPSKQRLSGHPLQHYRRRSWIVIEGALTRCNVTGLGFGMGILYSGVTDMLPIPDIHNLV